MNNTNASEDNAVGSFRRVPPRAVAGHRLVPDEQLLEEVVRRLREVLAVVIRTVALDGRLAVDLGQVLGMVREVGLKSTQHLLLGVTANAVHSHQACRIVEEDAPPDETEGLGYRQRAYVGPDKVAELLRFRFGRPVGRGLPWRVNRRSFHTSTHAGETEVPRNVAQAFHKVQGGADTIGREMAHTAMNEIWRNAGENRRSRSKSENFLGPQELGVERSDFQNVALVRLRELDDLPARQREAPDVVELRANATPMEQLLRADESQVTHLRYTQRVRDVDLPAAPGVKDHGAHKQDVHPLLARRAYRGLWVPLRDQLRRE